MRQLKGESFKYSIRLMIEQHMNSVCVLCYMSLFALRCIRHVENESHFNANVTQSLVQKGKCHLYGCINMPLTFSLDERAKILKGPSVQSEQLVYLH